MKLHAFLIKIVPAVSWLLAGLMAAGAVSAQSAAQKPPQPDAARPAPPPVPAEPGSTTASFGDWSLRCQRLQDASQSLRLCEIAIVVQVQGQAAPVAQLAIGRATAGDKLHATLVLPSNISLPSTVHLGAEPAGKSLDLAWARCVPGACYADATLPDEMIKAMKAAAEPWKAVFKDAAGRDITIPVSMRGMAPAFDALMKEPAG